METLLATLTTSERERKNAYYHSKNREIGLHKGQREGKIMSNLGITFSAPW
jgi:hypothetical protein